MAFRECEFAGKEPWRREALDEKKAELDAIFERHGILAAYVFGSLARDPTARKKPTSRSDLDLAVLVPEGWTPEQRIRILTLLDLDLSALFGRGDIDLLVANDAPQPLRHEITRRRDVIYGRDTRERVRFDWHTLREYLDTEHMRQIRYRVVLRRAREGRLGRGPRARAGAASTRRA